jgi:hypothetical protein
MLRKVVTLLLGVSAVSWSGSALGQNIQLSGNCTMFANAGQSFVLNGLGQRDSMACTFGPANQVSGVAWGEAVVSAGQLTSLKVKQSPPPGYTGTPNGGTLTITVYPKKGTAPVSTGISCVLAGSGDNYSCSSNASYSVVPGDRVIATVAPPSSTSVNPVSATVEIVPASSGQAAFPGYCDTVAEQRNSLGQAVPFPPFVLNALGQQATALGQQMSDTACDFFTPTAPSVFVGTPIAKAPGDGYTGFSYAMAGTLSNLFAKQQQHSDPGSNPGQNGGAVQVWINPKTGGLPVQTALGCSLGPCQDSTHTYTVNPGDQVIVRIDPGNILLVNPVAASVDFTETPTSPLTAVLSGICITAKTTYSKPTVLYGLGQRAPFQKVDPWKNIQIIGYTTCDYSPGTLSFPDVWLGEPAAATGTLTNLIVKQQQLQISPGVYTPMGGRVDIWLSQKSGGTPFFTGITCTLPTSGTFGSCTNSGTHTVSVGDRVIAIATPSGSELSPVRATVDIVASSNPGRAITLTGYCDQPGDAGASLVLYGLGQTSDDKCFASPAVLSYPYTSLNATLGIAIPSPGSVSSGTVTNLSVKQELTTSGGVLGGTVTVWVNPKNGPSPIKTGVTCRLTVNSSNFASCYSSAGYSAAPGDKIIVVADSPGAGTGNAQSSAPISATVDFTY